MSGASLDPRSTAFQPGSVPEHYERRLVPALFAPWAALLVDLAGVREGQAVLDVASGTGVVARLAAARVGPSGRVVASDVSAAMLAFAGTLAQDPGAAAIERVEAPATALPFPDGTFDVVLCQQGWPFIADRAGAAAELRRVLAPGGVAAVAIFASGRRLEPFEAYNEALQAHGVPAPYPMAYEGRSFTMDAAEVEALLSGAGLREPDVRVHELEVVWPDADAAAAGILGTPFGPTVAALDPERRASVLAALRAAFGGGAGPVRRTSAAVIGRGTSPGV